MGIEERCEVNRWEMDLPQLIQPLGIHITGQWRWALISPDGVAPSQMVGMSASVNPPLHHKVQKFSSGTGSPGWSRKKGHKTVVVWWSWVQLLNIIPVTSKTIYMHCISKHLTQVCKNLR